MATCTGFIEPLNLECWLVNVFSGTLDIFIFISLIVIATLGARFKMLNSTLLIIFGLYAIIMAQFMTGIYFLVVLLGGLISAWAITKMVKT